MSARQRARIASHVAILGGKGESEGERDGSDTDDGSVCRDRQPKRYHFHTTDSSSDTTNTDNDEGDNPPPSLPVALLPVKELPLPDEEDDVIQFLDSVISQHKLPTAHNSSDTDIQTLYNLLFSIDDPRALDVRSTLRRRAGDDAMDAVAGGGAQGGGMAGRGQLGRGLQFVRSNRNTSKRFVFGTPSEDWPRVPSFAAGGMGMQRIQHVSRSPAGRQKGSVESRYRQDRGGVDIYAFAWSPHYAFLQSQYGYVQATGDPNLLLMFLAHFPHSHMALLQLAVVYARSGQLEKALDLCCRALYTFESAAVEAFKPWGMQGYGTGTGTGSGRAAGHSVPSGSSVPCWLETTSGASQGYCAALMLYTDLCSALGCHIAAAETARYLLSLNPEDVTGVLLVLDVLLLTAGKYQLLQAFCGYTDEDGQGELAALPAAQLVLKGAFCSRYRLTPARRREVDAEAVAGDAGKAGVGGAEAEAGELERAQRGLEHLPNWTYSLALSEFLRHRDEGISSAPAGNGRVQGQEDGSGLAQEAQARATALLKTALLRWPFVLRPLLLQAGAGCGAGSGWEAVLKHALFHKAENRFQAGSYLSVVTAVYIKRSAALWSQVSVQAWLLQCCRDLALEVNAEGPGAVDAVVSAQVALYRDLLAPSEGNDCLARYGETMAADFFGEFPPFPGNASPIDPTLDDPQYILSGAVRFRDFMNEEGEYMFEVPVPFASTLRRRREHRRHRPRPPHNRRHGRDRDAGSSSDCDGGSRSEENELHAGSGWDEEDEHGADGLSGDGDWLEQLGARLGLPVGLGRGRTQVGVAGGAAAEREGPTVGRIYGRLLTGMGDAARDHGAAGAWAGPLRGAAVQAQGPPTQPNIDLGLPLVQLLIATLFPWIVVPPPQPRR